MIIEIYVNINNEIKTTVVLITIDLRGIKDIFSNMNPILERPTNTQVHLLLIQAKTGSQFAHERDLFVAHRTNNEKRARKLLLLFVGIRKQNDTMVVGYGKHGRANRFALQLERNQLERECNLDLENIKLVTIASLLVNLISSTCPLSSFNSPALSSTIQLTSGSLRVFRALIMARTQAS